MGKLGVVMGCLKKDIDLRLLFLVLSVLLVFVVSSIYYHLSLNSIRNDYDEKVSKLEEIEKQLILQDKRLRELIRVNNVVEEDKESLEKNYDSMKNDYQFLKLEKDFLADEMDSKPFSKVICKITGNAECHN